MAEWRGYNSVLLRPHVLGETRLSRAPERERRTYLPWHMRYHPDGLTQTQRPSGRLPSYDSTRSVYFWNEGLICLFSRGPWGIFGSEKERGWEGENARHKLAASRIPIIPHISSGTTGYLYQPGRPLLCRSFQRSTTQSPTALRKSISLRSKVSNLPGLRSPNQNVVPAPCCGVIRRCCSCQPRSGGRRCVFQSQVQGRNEVRGRRWQGSVRAHRGGAMRCRDLRRRRVLLQRQLQ